MSEEGKAQLEEGPEQPVNFSAHGTLDLTTEEKDFLKMLCRVLPKLVIGLELPTGGPSPLPAQKQAPSPDKKGLSRQLSSGRSSFAEIQNGLDSGGDYFDRLGKAPRQHRKTVGGLIISIEKFRKIEKRIRAVEGGVQLMDALVELRQAARDSTYKRDTPEDVRTVFRSFKKASEMLTEAFKRLGEGFIKDKHLAPLHELFRFCRLKNFVRIHEREIPTLYLSLGEHIDNVTKNLSEVFDSALPEFLKAREKALSIDYNNMLIAATFFSAVTATTLQLSYAYNASSRASLGVAVNTLWFVALVFSTASSLNSLVGLTWYQKIRRDQLLPNWVRLWIGYGPTISLVVASAAFSAGLCLFTFSSSQSIVTSALTATFTVAHAVALFAPLCLYSPNSTSRFLLKVFTKSSKAFTRSFSYFREVCLKRWYLRKVPRQDRYLVSLFMVGNHWSKANVIDAQRKLEGECIYGREFISEMGPIAASSPAGDAGPGSGSGPVVMVKRKIKNAWTSARSVVAWSITRRPDWLTLRRRRTHTNKESSDMEQTHGAGTSYAAELDELERGNVHQESSGEPETQIYIGTGLPYEVPQASISVVTDSDQVVVPAAKEKSKEVENYLHTRATLRSTEESITATLSTEHLILGSRSSPVARTSSNGFQSGARKAASTSKKPNVLQEEKQEHPFDISAQGGDEARNIDAPNPTSKVGHRRRVAFEGDHPSADVGSPGSLK